MSQLFLRGHSFPTLSQIRCCGGRHWKGPQGASPLLWINACERIEENLIAGRENWNYDSGSWEFQLTRQGALERALPVRVAQWRAEMAGRYAPPVSVPVYGKCPLGWGSSPPLSLTADCPTHSWASPSLGRHVGQHIPVSIRADTRCIMLIHFSTQIHRLP